MKNSREKTQPSKASGTKLKDEKFFIRRLALMVACLGFILNINTLKHGYVLDDYSLIAENSVTQKGIHGLSEIFSHTYRYGFNVVSDQLYRPLSKAMFAIEWEIAPNQPTLSHWVNVLLYGLTGFMLMLTLFKYTKSATMAFVASLLFTAHPVHTEVVANIKSRDEILAFLFFILTLYFWKLFIEEVKKNQLVWTALFFFLALLSKESAVTFLAVFCMVWYFFDEDNTKYFLKPIPGILLSTLLFFLIRQFVVGNVVSLDPPVTENFLIAAPDLSHKLASSVYVIGSYILLLFFPHPLVFDYSINQIPIISLDNWRFTVSLLFITGIVVYSIIRLKRRELWVFGVLFFFITFSLSCNIFVTIGTGMAERLLYTPSLGFCLAMAWIFEKVSRSDVDLISVRKYFYANKKSYLVISLVVICYSFKTMSRNLAWKDNLTLFSNDVLLSPNSARIHYYLGNCLANDVRMDEISGFTKDSIIKVAISELNKAIEIYPLFTDAIGDLAYIYYEKGDYAQTLIYYRKVTEITPKDAVVHNNIGTVYIKMSDYERGLMEFLVAIKLNPSYSDAYFNLGYVLEQTGKLKDAIEIYKLLINLDKNDPSAWQAIAKAYQKTGDEVKAKDCYAKANKLMGVL